MLLFWGAKEPMVTKKPKTLSQCHIQFPAALLGLVTQLIFPWSCGENLYFFVLLYFCFCFLVFNFSFLLLFNNFFFFCFFSPTGRWEGQVHSREGRTGEACGHYSRRGRVDGCHTYFTGAAGVRSGLDWASSSWGCQGYRANVGGGKEHHVPSRRREGWKPESFAECWSLRKRKRKKDRETLRKQTKIKIKKSFDISSIWSAVRQEWSRGGGFGNFPAWKGPSWGSGGALVPWQSNQLPHRCSKRLLSQSTFLIGPVRGSIFAVSWPFSCHSFNVSFSNRRKFAQYISPKGNCTKPCLAPCLLDKLRGRIPRWVLLFSFFFSRAFSFFNNSIQNASVAELRRPSLKASLTDGTS